MRYRLTVIAVLTGLLVTGCSGNTSYEAKYDEVQLIQYKACFEFAVNSWKNTSYLNSEFVTDNAIEACNKYLPIKQ
jgi:hypothetical protein